MVRIHARQPPARKCSIRQSLGFSLAENEFALQNLSFLEQDLIVNQQQRQQEVRYVLSMAREFPQALQDLRDNGRIRFSLGLETPPDASEVLRKCPVRVVEDGPQGWSAHPIQMRTMAEPLA